MTDDVPLGTLAGHAPITRPSANAALRATESFFADRRYPDTCQRRCRGLSCRLAGATAVFPGTDEQPVYCLGYCDQSPAALTADGTVLTGPQTEAARPTSVRCAARTPVVTARLQQGDHSSLHAARNAGVYSTLADWVRHKTPQQLLDTVLASGERGRGGAGYPTGAKWQACAAAANQTRVVIANGDEGDPGSYVDRLLMEQDPHAVIEGLALCAFAVAASHGVIYVRSEYPHARARMEQAVAEATAAGVLGMSVTNGPYDFTIEVVSGHGSYVCGEETALLNAIEGCRGEVRLRPPYPAEHGLFGLPTVVNNVETLVNIPWIARHGAAAYRQLGTADAPGTKAMCLNHGFARPGVVEVEFGTSLRMVIEELGGGGAGGVAIDAVALGGPMGSVLLPDAWDAPVAYLEMHARGIELGHGGLVAFPAGTDYRTVLREWLEFMALESCGRCVVCRVGSREALTLAAAPAKNRAELQQLLGTIATGSLCAFGRNIPRPAGQLLDMITTTDSRGR